MFLEVDSVRSSRWLKLAAITGRRYPFKSSPRIHVSPNFNCTPASLLPDKRLAQQGGGRVTIVS